LGSIVAARFVGAGGASLSISGAKLGPSSIQNDVEWVEGLTIDALDRMHWFTRMVGKTGWAVTDIDLVLGALADTTLGVPCVENIAQLHALQGRFGLSIGDLCSLVGPIPQTPGSTSPSLFDQLFNAPLYVASSGLLPQATTQFFHPSFLKGVDIRPTTAKTIAKMLPRLLTGLGVSLGDLDVLIRGLARHL